MHISKLSVIRMGAVTDKTIELGPTLNIIYGENEAGKTTFRQSLRMALYPISPQMPLEFGKSGPREVSISIQDGSQLASITRTSKSERSSLNPQGSAEALEVLDRFIEHLSWNDFHTVYNIGTEEIENVESRDVSALMAAEWGSGVNPTQVMAKLDSVLAEFKKKARKSGTQSITYSIQEIKDRLDKVRAVQSRYAEAQIQQNAIEDKRTQADAIGALRDEVRASISVLEQDVESLKSAHSRLPVIDARLAELTLISREADSKLQDLKQQINYPLLDNELLILDQIDQTTAQVQSLTARMSHLEGQISSLEAQYRTHKDLPKFSSVADLQAITVKLTRLEDERNTSQRELENSLSHIQYVQQELQQLEVMLDDASFATPTKVGPAFSGLLALSGGVFAIVAGLTQILSANLLVSLVIGLTSAALAVGGYLWLSRRNPDLPENSLLSELQAKLALKRADLATHADTVEKRRDACDQANNKIAACLKEYGLDAYATTDLLDLISLLKNAESSVRLSRDIEALNFELSSQHTALEGTAAAFITFIRPFMPDIPQGLSVQKLLALTQQELSRQKSLQIDVQDTERATDTRTQEAERLNEELASLKSLVNETIMRNEDLIPARSSLDETVMLVEQHIVDKRRILDEKEDEHAALHTEIGSLIESVKSTLGDTTLESVYAELSTLRGQLRRDLTDFVTTTIAREMLAQSLVQYGSTKERDLLQIGSEILNDITEGELVKIEIEQSTDELICQRRDGQVITPKLMSTGTREQLFMALRFGALISRQEVGRPVPIIMDDTFAHSDYKRRAVAFRSIARLALTTGKQILYFTCHRNMADELAAIALQNAVPEYRTIELKKD